MSRPSIPEIRNEADESLARMQSFDVQQLPREAELGTGLSCVHDTEESVTLKVGDIFYASVGTEHVAHPLGPARILVIESQGSV
jgi:hypothetical protein